MLYKACDPDKPQIKKQEPVTNKELVKFTQPSVLQQIQFYCLGCEKQRNLGQILGSENYRAMVQALRSCYPKCNKLWFE